MNVILSIKPEYVEKIFSGEKRYEYRKSLFKQNVDIVYIYASRPVSKIVGEFKIKAIISDNPTKVWKSTKKYAGITKSFFDKYYKGKEIAIAYAISDVKRYLIPVSDGNLPKNFKAPQSFVYTSMIMKEEVIDKSLIQMGFETELYEAAYSNLLEEKNKLRFNNFAYSIRELSRHILYRLAPDDEIKACRWYKPQKDSFGKEIITRGERIDYAIHGGIDNNILIQWKIKGRIDKSKKVLLEVIDTLSKYTHINKDTFNVSSDKTHELVIKVTNAFNLFAQLIRDTKEILSDTLIDQINDSILEETLYNTNSDIDILSTHSSIEEYSIDKIKVEAINSSNAFLNVEGMVGVRLQYGSDGDQKRDDGYVTSMDFPYQAEMSTTIGSSLKKFKIEGDIHFEVDTADFYGDDDTIE